ncbi:tRNA pseudouridine synthase A [Rickettsiales bacterium Ac37b]|nr:tRNA pseudouridine synthase A [Rickettsiales bacterium Ac37b]
MALYTRYKIIIEYDGTNYCGWQKQQNAVSVQQRIEEAIRKFSQEVAVVYGAGRTDAGVHATGQVAHFDLYKKFNCITIQNALNFYLQRTNISILNCEIVDKHFHARFSALKRAYKYIIINRAAPLSLERNRAWHIKHSLDLNAMQKAVQYLIGQHDFSSFRAAACQASTPIRTIDKINIEQINEYIFFDIAAPSFLHHMVRNIVGSLKLVGEHAWLPENLNEVLLARDRAKAGPTSPACGLYFTQVIY